MSDVQIPSSLTNAKIVIVFGAFRSGVRGGMLSVLWRARRFVEYGLSAQILTFDYHLDYPLIREQLVQSGRMNDQVDLVNIHEYLKSDALDSLPVIDAKPVGDDFEESEADVLRYKLIIRSRSWPIGEDKHFVEYFRDNGSIYMRATVIGDRSMWKGAQDIQLLGSDGQVRAELASTRDLWAFWLQQISGDDEVFVIQDFQYMSQSGDEIFFDLISGSNVYNYRVAHGATLAAPITPTTHLVPGWAAADRYNAESDGLVFLTDQQLEHWSDRFGQNPNQFSIPHECMVDSFEQSNQDGERCILIASLTPLKRVGDAILAFSGVLKKRPGATLEVFGEGPSRDDLLKLIAELGVEHAVVLHGYSAGAAQACAGAALSLLTSTREAFGMTILESMSRGCPVVAYDIDYGPRTMISHGKDGYLVESGDIAELERAMLRVLEADSASRDRMRAAALEKAKTYSGPAVIQRWIDMFESSQIRRGVTAARRESL
ncbi:glycosyltransferase [Pseudarthrobacter sp. J1738]|uniref:glycosyltransferase n=1 Tax=Pseudarthrobacter sp. J1738 TaxID=3420446 RepID=UPI003D283C56